MPSKSRRSSKAKPARKVAKPSKSAKRAPAAKKAKSAPRKSARKAGKSAKPKAAKVPDGRCPAKDPFGDPCQNTPRLGMKFCGIHSYLEA